MRLMCCSPSSADQGAKSLATRASRRLVCYDFEVNEAQACLGPCGNAFEGRFASWLSVLNNFTY
jgi:hypothetical protein